MEWTQNQNNTNTSIDEDIFEPPQYQVIFLNDDFTTKEFVVHILMSIFHKNKQEAELLMETVHQKGSAVIGAYPYDIAATKAAMTISNARTNGFPLQCKMEQV
ncbi:MAG: ATP-dependent Clp protease adaptor ClpS [Treponema sp.]|nr:ATP-dependent Clp protease adaptor ClpS [Treponema sp.]